MANTTDIQEFNLSVLKGGDLVTMLQGINEMAGGYLGVIMLVTIMMVIFGILALFGDQKGAFFGSSFTGLILGFIFLAMGLMTPGIFFLFVILNIAIIIVITR